MANRPTTNGARISFTSWSIEPEFHVEGDKFTSMPPERRLSNFLKETPEMKATIADYVASTEKTVFAGNTGTTGPVTTKEWGNIRALTTAFLRKDAVVGAWKRMQRYLKTKPLPVGQSGWVFEERFKLSPTPAGTPKGMEWELRVNISSSSTNRFPWNAGWALVRKGELQ